MSRRIILILPDIRSTHNTGSLFRTSDGAGVEKIYLTGITAAPPHPHLLKVSLGAEKFVPWEHVPDVVPLLNELRAGGWQLVAAEQDRRSVDYQHVAYSDQVALLLGNEVTGVPPHIIDMMDTVIELPMRGQKESLNVSVAGGVLLYHLSNTSV